MYNILILLLAFLGMGSSSRFSYADTPIMYAYSSNGSYAARILPGNFVDETAQAIVLQFDSATGTFERLHKLDLPHKYLPLESVLTNDGHFLITLGNVSGGDDLEAAVAIFNLQSGRSRVFSLNDIFTKEQISGEWNSFKGKFCIYYPHFQQWFQNIPHVKDEEQHVIYLSGISQVAKDPTPTIVVKCDEFDVSTADSIFWKDHYDLLRILSTREQKAIEQSLSVEQHCLLTLVRTTAAVPNIKHESMGVDYLIRMEPSLGTTECRLRILKYNSKSEGYDSIQVMNLRNPVAPGLFYVSNSLKYVMTFDELDQVGTTPNTIVIYDLKTGDSKAFGLADFCSNEDIQKMLSTENVRLWRCDRPWLSVNGAWFSNLNSYAHPGIVPHVLIDFEKKEVRLAEPFCEKSRIVVSPPRDEEP